MLMQALNELGVWNWMVLGLVLLILEIVVPGVFMLWIGIAALLVGAISLAFVNAAFWTWQIQVVAFVVLSLLSVYVGKRIYDGRRHHSDQPMLNQRGQQLVGRTATLTEPIRNGRGRIQLGDTLWRVSGPDLPAGSDVRVIRTSETDLELIVEAI